MKVLFAVPRLHSNHDGMVAGLLAAGHEVGFLVRTTSAREARRDGVAVTVLGGAPGGARRPRGFLPAFRFAYGFLRRTRPDLVIGRNADSTTYAVFLACRLLGIRFLLYLQARAGYESMSPGRRLRLWLGLWPRHTVNSACVAPARPIRGKTFDFLPFAVEVVAPAKANYPDRPPIRLLAVAKLDQPRKNLAALVWAAAPFLRAGEASLTIAGFLADPPGPAHAELLAEIARQDVGDRVRLLQNLDYAASRRLYAEHDVFVLASSREPAAVSPAEAMAAGLPAICGSDNGTNYLIAPGATGFVFPDGDFAELGRRIGHFVAEPSEVERMGRAALRSIETDYTPAAYARRLAEIVARRFG